MPGRLAKALLLAGASLLILSSARAGEPPEAERLYGEHCASCHGADRLGGTGPALLPQTLERLTGAKLVSVIAQGRPATQMQGFSSTLGEDEIAALAAYLGTPPAEPARWGRAQIESSRTVFLAEPAVDRPVYDADPLNLFVVVESGDHHVTILDGDRFEPIFRFPTHYALHGGPKFSPDGRYVYFVSRDGWVTKFDLYGLTVMAEIRVGINARNLAVSGDGRVLAVANFFPETLVMLDAADLAPITIIPAVGGPDKTLSRVSAVYQAEPRGSFVVALKDVPEIWEIPYGESSEPVYTGLVHSYEEGMVEALPAATGCFPIRRIETEEPLDDFFFSPDYRELIGSERERHGLAVVHLDTRQTIARIPLPGLPHLGSGITWVRDGHRVLATPDLDEPVVSVIDMDSWQVVERIPTLGPGFFLRSHENTPYAWVDIFFGPDSDALQVIDKETLEVVATLRPEPGKTAAHVEFTRDGRYALASIWDMDGAVVVYDAMTLEEIKRIPMVKPSGKYNVYNKISLSEGTSH